MFTPKGGGHDAADRSTVAAGPDGGPRARRPSGRGGGNAVPEELCYVR